MNLPHNHGHISQPLRSGIQQDARFDGVSELMKTLGDGKRLQIFWLLCHCEECVINIATLLNMPPSTASHHLKLLKDAGLIINRREGKEVYYTAADVHRTHLLHSTLETLLEMQCPLPESAEEGRNYDSQVHIIDQIHRLLTENLQQRYTIEELSAQFHINPTTLKTEFKRIYGQPIAAYMKSYRMQQAAQMLRQTEASIANIAATLGYENQSKFSQAFRDVMGVLPKDFRRK